MLLLKSVKNCHLFNFLNVKRVRLSSSWISPSGRDTGVSIYNPYLKAKVPLCYQNESYLSLYSCGPTVYDVTHIGHASSYVRLDIIRRLLSQWFNVDLVIALGITDIDDKIITRSKSLNVDFLEISRKYELEFFRDMNFLNVLEPNFVLRVTEHIPEIINFVESLIQKGNAYILKGSVYFNTQSLPHYGKLTRAPVLTDNAKPEEGGRLNQADFSLWKAVKPDEPSWPSPWSPGRPGWHIECSAMASKVFGNELDIHTGGLDLAFPHHENEEAQSCAYHSTNQWANYWLHTGHLLMNGMKMSKSMKNFIPISEFLTNNTADHFRMLCLMTHYRTSIDYTGNVITKAVVLSQKFEEFLVDAKSYCNGSWKTGHISSSELLTLLEKTRVEIKKCLADDFNTAQSINLLEELVQHATAMLHSEPVNGSSREVAAVAAVANFVEFALQSVGLRQAHTIISEKSSHDYVIEKSVNFRNNIRQVALSLQDKSTRSQLLKHCDQFRSDMKAGGISVKDTQKLSS